MNDVLLRFESAGLVDDTVIEYDYPVFSFDSGIGR
jgi:hypothetical protein